MTRQVIAVGARPKAVYDSFSVSLLLRTLLSPWKQIVAQTRPDQSAQIKMRVGVDNMVSRLVGFVVRSLVLVTASIGVLIAFVWSVAYLLLWIALPPLIVLLIPIGVSLS